MKVETPMYNKLYAQHFSFMYFSIFHFLYQQYLEYSFIILIPSLYSTTARYFYFVPCRVYHTIAVI
jgi:hypothetical protein